MKEKTEAFEIIFYGSSGWFESTSGCTSCTGIFINDNDIILCDLGTGVRRLSRESVCGKNLKVILTHLHLDHCYGLHILPMFQPASVTIFIHQSLEPHLNTLLSFPFMKPRDALGFPIFIRLVEDSTIRYDNFVIKTKALEHNTPVIGAQLLLRGISISYCVDSVLCDAFWDITKNCDILIIESSPPEGGKSNGFHLGLEELKAVITATCAKKVIITHFGPLKYPDVKSREALFSAIKKYHDNIIMAHDNLVIKG